MYLPRLRIKSTHPRAGTKLATLIPEPQEEYALLKNGHWIRKEYAGGRKRHGKYLYCNKCKKVYSRELEANECCTVQVPLKPSKEFKEIQKSLNQLRKILR